MLTLLPFLLHVLLESNGIVSITKVLLVLPKNEFLQVHNGRKVILVSNEERANGSVLEKLIIEFSLIRIHCDLSSNTEDNTHDGNCKGYHVLDLI